MATATADLLAALDESVKEIEGQLAPFRELQQELSRLKRARRALAGPQEKPDKPEPKRQQRRGGTRADGSKGGTQPASAAGDKEAAKAAA